MEVCSTWGSSVNSVRYKADVRTSQSSQTQSKTRGKKITISHINKCILRLLPHTMYKSRHAKLVIQQQFFNLKLRKLKHYWLLQRMWSNCSTNKSKTSTVTLIQDRIEKQLIVQLELNSQYLYGARTQTGFSIKKQTNGPQPWYQIFVANFFSFLKVL